MRGPRDVKAVVWAGVVDGLLVVAGAVAGGELVGVVGVVFVETESLAKRGRCLADGLRERFSFKTRRQNRMSPDGDALIPFCESRSLMAR